MKIHARKKWYQAHIHTLMHNGYITRPDGTWTQRPPGGNAMMRDFHPQVSGKGKQKGAK